MTNPALRDWRTLCPRRYDLLLAGEAGALALPATPSVRRQPQPHEWRLDWVAVDAAHLQPADDDGPSDPRAIPNGYFCARCLAHVQNNGRVVDRYFGDPEEMQAMTEAMAARSAATEGEGS